MNSELDISGTYKIVLPEYTAKEGAGFRFKFSENGEYLFFVDPDPTLVRIESKWSFTEKDVIRVVTTKVEYTPMIINGQPTETVEEAKEKLVPVEYKVVAKNGTVQLVAQHKDQLIIERMAN